MYIKEIIVQNYLTNNYCVIGNTMFDEISSFSVLPKDVSQELVKIFHMNINEAAGYLIRFLEKNKMKDIMNNWNDYSVNDILTTIKI